MSRTAKQIARNKAIMAARKGVDVGAAEREFDAYARMLGSVRGTYSRKGSSRSNPR